MGGAPGRADEHYYQTQTSAAGYNVAMYRRAEQAFRDVEPVLEAHVRRPVNGLLEIGAGSCAMGALVGRWADAGRVVFADISPVRTRRAAPEALRRAAFTPDSFEVRQLDMNTRFDLPSASFDLVLFHASLHHARNLWNCLEESFRVLRPGGQLLGLREQVVPRLRAGRALRRLLTTAEVREGVSENAYLVEQYLYYLDAVGFSSRGVPRIHGSRHRTLKRLLWFANGWIFSSFVLIAEKPQG